MLQESTPTEQERLTLAEYAIEGHWLTPGTSRRRLLIAYAHPDDETFGNAGTILRYARAGVDVHYVCGTRGECGSVDPTFLEKESDIGLLRTAELMHAADLLGLASVQFLGYRDSGMQGAPENQHPQALAAANVDKVTGQIVASLRATRPQVVLTFAPYGGYGHPDHIMMHHATTAAFDKAADPACYPEQITAGLKPWQASKLYYGTFGTGLLYLMIAWLRITRKDPRALGTNRDIDLVAAAKQAPPITTSIDSGRFLPQKDLANKAHASQLGGTGPWHRIPQPIRRALIGNEHFFRARPQSEAQRVRERDLFGRIDP
ncbi:MAG: PIG-L family deacetylase [Herpetosiphon sp.]